MGTMIASQPSFSPSLHHPLPPLLPLFSSYPVEEFATHTFCVLHSNALQRSTPKQIGTAVGNNGGVFRDGAGPTIRENTSRTVAHALCPIFQCTGHAKR